MEKLKNIKGIFFDLGGTLLYPPSGNWMFSNLAYQYFPKETLSEPGTQDVMAKARAIIDENHLVLTLDEEYAQFHQYYSTLAQALPELGLTEKDIEAVTKDKVYNKADNYRLFDDTVRTLKAVQGKYRLGIISDTWPSIVPLLEYFGILNYFDCTTYSFELGTFKPDKRMYEDALSKMGLPAENTVFIDDSPGNLKGAQAAGIYPVHIHVMRGVEPVKEFTGIGKISDLLDLL